MDLKTSYMGLELKNPLVPSASPLSKSLEGIKKLEDAGAGAVVLYSLFEEQLAAEEEQLNYFLDRSTESFAEALSYFPEQESYNLGPEEYLKHIQDAKAAVDMPIIASINGVSDGGWINYAKEIEKAGADALELNVYFLPTDAAKTAAEIEAQYLNVLKSVKSAVSLPVALKLSPYFSAMANACETFDKAGADALVLFNRFYQPDIDLENLEVKPEVLLSTSNDLRLPLRWIAILYGNVQADLAGTSGVHTAMDALKLIASGAGVAQMCATLLKNGIGQLTTILNEMNTWLEAKEYASLDELRGSFSQQKVAEPAAYERANYVKAISDFKDYTI